MCLCATAWKGYPRNDLYCVGQDVKPYSLTDVSRYCIVDYIMLVVVELSKVL